MRWRGSNQRWDVHENFFPRFVSVKVVMRTNPMFVRITHEQIKIQSIGQAPLISQSSA